MTFPVKSVFYFLTCLLGKIAYPLYAAEQWDSLLASLKLIFVLERMVSLSFLASETGAYSSARPTMDMNCVFICDDNTVNWPFQLNHVFVVLTEPGLHNWLRHNYISKT